MLQPFQKAIRQRGKNIDQAISLLGFIRMEESRGGQRYIQGSHHSAVAATEELDTTSMPTSREVAKQYHLKPLSESLFSAERHFPRGVYIMQTCP